MDVKDAYGFGFDCGMKGPTLKNSAMDIFSKSEFTKAWEEGRKDAEQQKPNRYDVKDDGDGNIDVGCPKEIMEQIDNGLDKIVNKLPVNYNIEGKISLFKLGNGKPVLIHTSQINIRR